jgi:hypothetical protein
MRTICRVCGETREGPVGAVCGRLLTVPGVGEKPCAGKMVEWVSAVVPGLSQDQGKYDEQLNAVFAALNAPKLALLIVAGGPKGNGFSVAGEAGMVSRIPDILRNVAGDIEAQLSASSTTGQVVVHNRQES